MNHLSLNELSQKIKSVIGEQLEPSYWVVAEIGELRLNQKGHCYLELIEKAGDQLLARAKATIWSYTYRNLSTWFASVTGEELKSGIKVLANVQVSYHELYGFSLNIRDIDPRYTLGEKEKKKNETINLLISDGVFGMNKSLLLPLVPQSVAVISAPTAAGYEDFINQIEHNSYGYKIDLKLFKAIMQGQEAVESIIQALHRINNENEDYDLVVIIRGGGSRTDLDCYDHYDLASHIAQFPIPVITGIGHDRDESISDMVAHTQLKTPTAVSEFLILNFLEFESSINDMMERITTQSRDMVNSESGKLKNLLQHLNHFSRQNVYKNGIKLENFTNKIKTLPHQILSKYKSQIALLDKSIIILDPANTLNRGYTITTYKGKLLKKHAEIKPGSKIVTKSPNIELESIVELAKPLHEK